MVIISDSGVVREVLANDEPVGRNVDEVLRLVQALKYTDAHEGEACPVNWRPGTHMLLLGVTDFTIPVYAKALLTMVSPLLHRIRQHGHQGRPRRQQRVLRPGTHGSGAPMNRKLNPQAYREDVDDTRGRQQLKPMYGITVESLLALWQQLAAHEARPT